MGDAPVLEQLKRSRRVGLPVEGPDHQKLELLMESGKDYMLEHAKNLLQQCGSMPFLVSYSCDGTPCKEVVQRLDFQKPLSKQQTGAQQSQAQMRQGRMGKEVMVEHTFLRFFDALGNAHSGTIIKEPVPMWHGKDIDAVWGISRSDLFVARDHGHSGISIAHCTFDGGLFSGMCRRSMQEHMMRSVLRREEAVNRGLNPKDQLVTEWVVASRCTAHVCHNALKWAMSTCFPNGNPMKDLWEVCFGLNNSSGDLHRHLIVWLTLKVQFLPPELLPSPAATTQQWMAVGLPADLLDTVAAEWRLLWANDRLMISDVFAGDSGIIEDIADTILSFLTLEVFTESRWLTIGRSCRSLMLCMMFGLKSLVDYILAIPASNENHLSGFKKLFQGETQEFTLACALASYVSDGVLAEILEDNRAARKIHQWREVAKEEMDWVRSLDGEAMQGLVDRGLSGKLTARQLHDKVMHAALISWAFIEHEAFEPACQLPWSLGHGSIRDNLVALGQQEEEPDEPTTFKIWAALQKGTIPMNALVAGIRLLLECPWSTNTTEQQHASVSMVKRMHPDYTLKTILLRAGVHALGRLTPGLDKEDKLVEVLKKKMELMDGARTSKVNGRHMLLKALAEELQAQYEADNRKAPPSMYNRLFRMHGRQWQSLLPEERGKYEVMALQYKYDKENDLATAREELLALLRTSRHRAAEKHLSDADAPLTVHACRLTDAGAQRWQEIYDDLKQSPNTLKEKRQAAETCPEPLNAQEAHDLDVMPIRNKEVVLPVKPAWLPPVCRLRHQLRKAVLILMIPGGGNRCMKLLYCKQQPLEFHGIMVERCPPEAGDAADLVQGPGHLHDIAFLHTWRFNEVVFATWVDGQGLDIKDVLVFRNTSFISGGRIVTNEDAIPLQQVMDHADFPFKEPVECSGATEQEYKRRRTPDRDFAQHWKGAGEVLPDGEEEDTGACGSGDQEGGLNPGEGADTESSESEKEDAILDEAFRKLERDRPDGEGLVIVRLPDFQAMPRANGDAWQGQVKRKGEAQAWCKRVGLNQTFQVNMAVGAEAAKTLADAWAHRMQFLFDCASEGRFDTHASWATAMAEYQEPLDFVELASTGAGKIAWYAKAIRNTNVRV